MTTPERLAEQFESHRPHVRREDLLDTHVPDPIATRALSRGDEGPETDAMLADSVGLALLVVLESWSRRNDWRSCSTTCLG